MFPPFYSCFAQSLRYWRVHSNGWKGERNDGKFLAATALARQPLLQLRVERIVAAEHVIDIRDGHALRALLAQEARERVDMSGRAVQRDHSRRGWAAEGRSDTEALLCLREHRIVDPGCARAHLAERAGAAMRRDAIENKPRVLALLRAPFGATRRDQVR